MITSKLQQLAFAIRDFEGWKAGAGPIGLAAAGSASYRRHNPGNLRASPFAVCTDNNFAVFCDDATGLFALQYDLWSKCTGRTSTKLTGKNTVADLIDVYSPDSLEIRKNYSAHILRYCGIKADTPLSYFVTL